MHYSMSLLVVYFGFKDTGGIDLRHHNIILGPRYEELLTDIFKRKILASDFSQYLCLLGIKPALQGCVFEFDFNRSR